MDRRGAFKCFSRIADDLVLSRFPLLVDRETKNWRSGKQSCTYVRYSRLRPDGLYEALFIDREFSPEDGFLGNLSGSVSLTSQTLLAFTGPLSVNRRLFYDVEAGADDSRLMEMRWGAEWFLLGKDEDQLRAGLGFFLDLYEYQLQPKLEIDAASLIADPILQAANARLDSVNLIAPGERDALIAELEAIAPATHQGYPASRVVFELARFHSGRCV